MGKDYELAVYSKSDFVWDKEDPLVPGLRRPLREPEARGSRPAPDSCVPRRC
jgi:hypothetical protein